MDEAARSDEQAPFFTPRSGELWEKLKLLARQMRHEPTNAERVLWQQLRRNQIAGFHFRRQHAIERFIADFYCAAAGLVIEVDGVTHQYTSQEDAVRQEFLESMGLRVLRLTNDQVLDDIETVVDRIREVLQAGRPLPPAPSPRSGV